MAAKTGTLTLKATVPGFVLYRKTPVERALNDDHIFESGTFYALNVDGTFYNNPDDIEGYYAIWYKKTGDKTSGTAQTLTSGYNTINCNYVVSGAKMPSNATITSATVTFSSAQFLQKGTTGIQFVGVTKPDKQTQWKAVTASNDEEYFEPSYPFRTTPYNTSSFVKGGMRWTKEGSKTSKGILTAIKYSSANTKAAKRTITCGGCLNANATSTTSGAVAEFFRSATPGQNKNIGLLVWTKTKGEILKLTEKSTITITISWTADVGPSTFSVLADSVDLGQSYTSGNFFSIDNAFMSDVNHVWTIGTADSIGATEADQNRVRPVGYTWTLDRREYNNVQSRVQKGTYFEGEEELIIEDDDDEKVRFNTQPKIDWDTYSQIVAVYDTNNKLMRIEYYIKKAVQQWLYTEENFEGEGTYSNPIYFYIDEETGQRWEVDPSSVEYGQHGGESPGDEASLEPYIWLDQDALDHQVYYDIKGNPMTDTVRLDFTASSTQPSQSSVTYSTGKNVPYLSGSSSVPFTLPLDWCYGVPDYEYAIVVVKLTTQYNGTVLGNDFQELKVHVPSSVKPTVSAVSVTSIVPEQTSITDKVINGHSTLNLEATGVAGAYGSTIKEYTWGGQLRTASKTTTSTVSIPKATFNSSGYRNVTVTVTDSRGRKASVTTSSPINVLDYSSPFLSMPSAIRSDANGVSDDEGKYAVVTVNGGFTPLPGSNNQPQNSVTITATFTASGMNTSDAQATLTHTVSGKAISAPSQTVGSNSLSTERSYTVTFEITDIFGVKSRISTALDTSSYVFFLGANGKSVGIGTVPQGNRENVLEINKAWTIVYKGHDLDPNGSSSGSSSSSSSSGGGIESIRLNGNTYYPTDGQITLPPLPTSLGDLISDPQYSSGVNGIRVNGEVDGNNDPVYKIGPVDLDIVSNIRMNSAANAALQKDSTGSVVVPAVIDVKTNGTALTKADDGSVNFENYMSAYQLLTVRNVDVKLGSTGLAAGKATSISASVPTVPGYTPIGIIGWNGANDTGGSGISWITVYGVYLSGSSVSVKIRNTHASSKYKNLKYTVNVLYVKTGGKG